MAELTTTQEEKDAASYLDWDDASLGRFTKYMALKFAEVSAADPNGWRRTVSSAAALHLAAATYEANAGNLTIDFEAVTLAEKKIGDWHITVRKVAPDSDQGRSAAPVLRALSDDVLCKIMTFDPTEFPAMETAAVSEAARLGVDPVALLEAAERIAAAAAAAAEIAQRSDRE